MTRRARFLIVALVAALSLSAVACADTTAPRTECKGHQGNGTTPC